MCAKPKSHMMSYTDNVDEVGLLYGPDFQGVTEISVGANHALGFLQITDTVAGMPIDFPFPRLIHPATLENLLLSGR